MPLNRNHPDADNIDQDEISKFESMATRWWDPDGAYKALHDINGLRVRFVNQRAPLAESKVLDVGCGGGLLSEAMARKGASVTGIDMGPGPLAAARDHSKQARLQIDYRRTTVESLAASEAGRYDVVTCMEMLEHVPRPASVIQACARLTKPGGDVFFATLNRTIKSYLLAILMAEYVLGLVPRGTHTYARFIRPGELAAWAQAAGLQIRDLAGFHYIPFLRKCFLGGNAHVNYLMHLRLPKSAASAGPP